MKKKPLNPKLPGRYGTMGKRDLTKLAKQLGRHIALTETRPMTAAERAQWNRARHRLTRRRLSKLNLPELIGQIAQTNLEPTYDWDSDIDKTREP